MKAVRVCRGHVVGVALRVGNGWTSFASDTTSKAAGLKVLLDVSPG